MLSGRSVSALLAVFVLAGCSASPHAPAKGGLSASATTGVIRAVVVDEAIRPLGNATVEVTHGGAPLASKPSAADGSVGFDGLDPGGYFLHVTKKGYLDVQQPVTVVAGVSEPPITNIQLPLQVGGLPFYLELKFDGFVECSASEGNWCGIANFYPCAVEKTAGQPCTDNLTSDRSLFSIDRPLLDLQRVPDWLQTEMVWESTQSVSPYLMMRMDIDDPAELTIANETPNTVGASPLLVVYPPAWMADHFLGLNHTLTIETFHGGPQAVCDNDPTHSADCILVGAAVEQRFTDYLHAFYGYKPPEGWRFSTDGTVPPPG